MSYLLSKDDAIISSFEINEKDTFVYFSNSMSQSKMNVEICVYDTVTNVLQDTYNYKYTEFNKTDFVVVTANSSNNNTGIINLNTSNILNELGYIKGTYKVTYKFYINSLGSVDNNLFIRKISSTRKEIIIDYMNKDLLDDYRAFTDNTFYRFEQEFSFTTFANFGSDVVALLLNSKFQTDSSGESLILKLYQPLPAKFSNKDVLWITTLITELAEDIVSIDFELKQDLLSQANVLRGPNYSKPGEYIGSDYTSYKSYYDLIDTSSFGKIQFAGFNNNPNAEGINLNIKYEYFQNFVNFGSATQMLENFRSKVLAIEYYRNSKQSGSAYSTAYGYSSSLYNQNKELEIIGGFTSYENFLYFESGSLFTSSLYLDAHQTASLIDATWPKSGSNLSNYMLYSTTSSQVSQWYATMSAVAFDYDNSNVNALVKTLPEYIITDVLNNEQYITFLNMIGEFYDNIWLYILSTQRMLKRANKFEDGVPGEIIWNILRNYGLNLNNGQNLVDLTRYKYGYAVSGSTVSELQRTEQTITHEIWNRILNNYPYIFKAKGTEKALRALFNCYGIPNSLVEIQEFGGPFVTGSNTLTKYSFTYEDFTFVVEMNGGESIHIPWQTSSYDNMKPDSIEFKMRAPKYAGNMDIFSLTGSYGEMKLQLVNTEKEFGKFVLTINSASLSQSVSSSIKSFYNNEFYSIMVTRAEQSDNYLIPQDYTLVIQNHDDYINKIILNESVVLSIPNESASFNSTYINATDFYLGGNPSSTQKFIGAFDELRLWAEPLTYDTFTFHTKYSAATNGNTITSSLSSLAFRLSFNSASNLGVSPNLPNESFDALTYGNATASAIGFANTPQYPYSFGDFERSNTVEQSYIASDVQNNKIRIEQTSIQSVPSGSQIIFPLRGNYMINDTTIVGQIGEFDKAPPDIDVLLIGFTPTSFINRDIIAFYGNNDILSVYGDFDDIYQDSYPPNNFIIDTYWNNTRTGVSFNEYLKYIRTYNRSIFDIISELVPAKASLILGTVYEQNILRRSRIRLLHPEVGINYNQYLFGINEKDYLPTADAHLFDEELITSIDLNITQIMESDVEDITGMIQYFVVFPAEAVDEFDDAILHYEVSLPVQYTNEVDEGGIQYPFFLPIESFDETNEGDISYTLNPYNLTGYLDSYVNRQRNNTDRFRNLAKGTKNSSLTTTDRGPAVVLTASNPKKLIVNYADNPKLTVK